MPRLSPAVLLVVVCLGGTACATGSQVDQAATSRPPPTTAAIATDGSAPATTTVTTVGSGDTGDAGGGSAEVTGSACPVIERSETGRVERPELVETSGLAASRHHEGVLWAINDSGQQAGLYAFDHQGRDLGFFALVGQGGAISTLDVEDLAIVDRTLYLADIGDNARRRDTVAIHVVEEPDPTGTDGEVRVGQTIEIRYPDGPTDAEALLVDPVRGELLLLSKDLDDGRAPTRLYSVPLAPTDGQVVEATLVGAIDVAALTAGSDGFSLSTLLFPGSVTGGDLLVEPGADGDLITLRTYGSVWLYRRTAGASVAETLLSAAPCEVGAAAERQGEAVALLPPGPDEPGPGGRLVRYVTVSEGGNPPVNLSVAELSP